MTDQFIFRAILYVHSAPFHLPFTGVIDLQKGLFFPEIV